MKQIFFPLKKINLYIFFIFFSSGLLHAQSKNESTVPGQDQLISISLTHQSLFEQTGLTTDDISTFHILDHGVDLDFTSGLSIDNKPVVLIDKSDIAGLNGAPYFMFHTLNLEGTTAYARIYMTYDDSNETKTSNVDIPFIYNSGQWRISNNQ